MRAAAVDDALVLGDVAGGEDPGHRCSAAVSRRGLRRSRRAPARRCGRASRPAPRRRRSRRRRPRARARVLVMTRVTRPSAPSKRSSSSSPCTVIPCSASRSWKNRPASIPNATAQRHRLHHHHRAGAAQLGERRRDLAGDVGAADHDDPLAGRVLADRVAVAERPQVVDPLQLAPGDVQPAHVGAGGEQRLVERRHLLRRRAWRFALRVELRDRGPRQHLDLLLGVPVGGPEQRVLARLLAPQIALGAAAAGRRADRARARPAGSSRPRRTRAASARSCPTPARHRSAGSRPGGQHIPADRGTRSARTAA